MKEKIISEIEDRIRRLSEHKDDAPVNKDNPYSVVNNAVSKVVNLTLTHELEDIADFIKNC